MSASYNSPNKLGILSEFRDFFKTRKKWRPGPILLMMLLMGLIIIFTEGNAVAPFTYPLF